MTTKDRLKEFLSIKNIGRNKFEQQVGISTGYLSTRAIAISSEVIEKTANAFPDLNLEWLITGNGNMFKTDISSSAQELAQAHPTVNTKPRIPYTAAAGSITNAMDGVTDAQCEQIPVIGTLPSYDFTIIVKGNSMEPKIEGGDEVACKRVDGTSFIQWGKVHVLDTAQGILIKRIYEDGDKIKCVSYNPEYPPFSIDKSDIYSISLVVGLLRI